MQVPPPGDTEPVKAEVYCIRGETVSIGGAMEWIIAELARRFAHTTEKKPKRQWGDLKRYIKTEGLNPALQDELGDVTGYFRPRNLAAHAGVMIVGVAEATQIFRLYRDKGIPQVELVTLDELRDETATARSGYRAIQVVGRALDDYAPAVLADMNELNRARLLGESESRPPS